MDKLTLAHEWYLKHGKDNYMEQSIKLAFDYADAMQAEADKREEEKALRDAESHKKFMDMINQKEQNHHDELVSIGLDEWQPDWSQAPDDCHWFCAIYDGKEITGGWFFTNEPEIGKGNGVSIYHNGGDSVLTESFGYQGNWQDSLRKRPQGE